MRLCWIYWFANVAGLILDVVRCGAFENAVAFYKFDIIRLDAFSEVSMLLSNLITLNFIVLLNVVVL